MTLALDYRLVSHARHELAQYRRINLFSFVWGMFLLLHPGGDEFVPAWHVKAMCFRLQQAATLEIKRLLITVPPRHLKTICASVATAAFILGHNPSAKIIVATYGDELSSKILRDIKAVLQSAYYRELFPGTTLQSSREAELATTLGGVIRITSVRGSVTGFGADYIIVDDLMKAGDEDSEAEREKAKNFLSRSLMSRFNNKSKGCLIAIQQRLHEDDVAASLLSLPKVYTHLNLPAYAVEDEEIPIGKGKYHRRRIGDVLFPEREPDAVLREYRAAMGNYAFESQFQQNPTPEGGNLLDWERDWEIYDIPPARHECTDVVLSWDTANKDKETSDYSVGTVWGRCESQWYLLDVVREKLDSQALIQRILGQILKWNPDYVLIEDHGSGTFVLEYLRRRRKVARAKLMGITPPIGKIQRFANAVGLLKEEHFALPASAIWKPEFKRELTAFPKTKFDDQVDSFSQFACFLLSRRMRALENRGVRPRGQDFRSSRAKGYA